MDRIRGPGATGDNRFTEGDPAQSIPRTTVTADWANNVQEEICNAIEGGGGTLNAADRTQLLQAIQSIAANTGGGAGGKNLLLNGDFQYQQRVRNAGTFAVGNANTYTFDRWRCRADGPGSGTGTATVSRQPHTLGQVAVPGAPRWFGRWQQLTPASVGAPTYEQAIESVGRFGSGPLTRAVWLKAGATLPVTLRLVQKFGTGGSPSADVIVAQRAVTVSNVWQRFEVSVDLTGFSVAGKVLGTNGDDHLLVQLVMPQGTTYTLDFSDEQLERATVPTTFDRRPPGTELPALQRYYERTGDLELGLDWTPGGSVQAPHLQGYEPNFDVDGSGANLVRSASQAFRTVKRRVPTMRWWTPGLGSTAPVADAVKWGVAGDPDRVVSSTQGASSYVTGAPRLSAGPTVNTAAWYRLNWEADAELY